MASDFHTHKIKLLHVTIILPFIFFANLLGAMVCQNSLTYFTDGSSPYSSVLDTEYPAFEPSDNNGRPLLRVVRTRIFTARDSPLTATLSTVETRPEIDPTPHWQCMQSACLEGTGRRLMDIDAWVNFALEQYKRRGWPDAFKNKLEQYAIDYAHRSTYLIVRQTNSDGASGDILATLRFVSSGYYGDQAQMIDAGVALPMESYLNVQLPRPFSLPQNKPSTPTFVTGEILEPGNFAIRKNLSPELTAQILGHFLAIISLPSYHGTVLAANKHIYTYADGASGHLYTSMGFQQLEGIPSVQKDGVTWQIYYTTPNKLIENLNAAVRENDSGKWKSVSRIFERALSSYLQ